MKKIIVYFLILWQLYPIFIFSQGSPSLGSLVDPADVIQPRFPGGQFRTPFPPPPPVEPSFTPIRDFQEIIKNFYQKTTGTWSPEQIREFVIISMRNYGLPVEEEFITEALKDLLERTNLSRVSREMTKGGEVLISEYEKLGFKTYSKYFPISETEGRQAKVVKMEITNSKLYAEYQKKVGTISQYSRNLVTQNKTMEVVARKASITKVPKASLPKAAVNVGKGFLKGGIFAIGLTMFEEEHIKGVTEGSRIIIEKMEEQKRKAYEKGYLRYNIYVPVKIGDGTILGRNRVVNRYNRDELKKFLEDNNIPFNPNYNEKDFNRLYTIIYSYNSPDGKFILKEEY